MIIVTGAAGQLGHAVTEELISLGKRVLSCDMVNRPSKFGKRCSWIKLNLENLPPSFAWPSEAKTIIHLAGSKYDVQFSVNSAISLLRANLLTVASTLAACRDNIKRLIYISSISVYDPSIEGTITEEALVNPQSSYGISKLLGEKACQLFAIANPQIDVVIIRLAQVYGPGTWKNNAIYRLIEQALLNKNLILSCSSGIKRDYIHLDDAKRGIVQASLKCSAGIYNLGQGSPISMGQIASIIAKKVPACEAPKFSAGSKTDSVGCYLSIKRFVDLTGFSPKISFYEGIKHEVERHLSKVDT